MREIAAEAHDPWAKHELLALAEQFELLAAEQGMGSKLSPGPESASNNKTKASS
jgi:hypothetical protein